MGLLLLMILCRSCLGFPIANRGRLDPSMRFKVFKARYPLEGGPRQLRLHVAVIIQDTTDFMFREGEESSEEERMPQLVLFDFLPQEPTALATAFILLTGGDVSGKIRQRTLHFLPRGASCIGETDATLEDMESFVSEYPNRLSLTTNSCNSFVDSFVARHVMRSEPL